MFSSITEAYLALALACKESQKTIWAQSQLTDFSFVVNCDTEKQVLISNRKHYKSTNLIYMLYDKYLTVDMSFKN